ncbi:nucleolar protein 7 [Amblyraja radiata]|uniref:nucleolar protein 7 n=1 Tax=Amblyraja radiata TaxID=386614 RepID=UPI00140269A4|nr:nucleolar protein 7 [Amblyraja radiata]
MAARLRRRRRFGAAGVVEETEGEMPGERGLGAGGEERDGDDGDDDELPDEETFSSGRERAERRLESARREKALLKEKRKQKLELFREQKKRKLLPDDILEEIASIPKKIDQAPASRKKGRVLASVQKPEQDSGLEEDTEECIDIRWKQSYRAVQLKDHGRKNQQVRKAKSFMKRRLYGRKSRRSTVNEYFSYENKRSQKAAMQFVNSSWGTKKKQKADKYRKQWLQNHCAAGR